MAIHIPKQLLVEGAGLLAGNAHTQDDGLVRVCAAGLRAIAEQHAAYENATRCSKAFMTHLHEELHRLCGQFSLPGGACSASATALRERAFCLTEDMAVIMREKILRSGCAGACAAETELMAFFEGSGHWRAGDGTLVTDAYYVQLPVAVLHELLRRVQDAMDKAV